MRNTIISILIIIINFPIISNAITLDEAKKIALENNPQLLAQEQATKNSRAGYWRSLLNLIPSGSITGNYTRYDDEQPVGPATAEEFKTYGYIISQPIFNGGSIWLGSRLSNDTYKISRETLNSQRLNTIADVESKYFSVLENKALLEISGKSLQNATVNLEIAEVQYESGILSRADYLNLQSEKANREVSLIQTENLYLTSLLDLTNFLHLNEIAELEEVAIENFRFILNYLQDKELSEIESLISKLMQVGMENNPSIKISELAVASSKKNLHMAGGKFLPSVNLQYSKNWIKYDFDDEYNSSGQLGINLSLPVFPLFDNGLEVAKANYSLKQAKYEKISAEDNVSLSLKSSIINLLAAARTVHSLELALQYSRDTYEQMQERFAAGLITSNDLLATDIMYSSTQNQYISSIYNFLRARSGLMLQIGIEDEQILENYIR